MTRWRLGLLVAVLAITTRLCGQTVYLYPPSISSVTVEQLAQAMEQAQQLAHEMGKFNVKIAQARDRFWATYPDKPGFDEASAEFSSLLWKKDLYCMCVVFFGGGNMEMSHKITTLIDGGFRPDAGDELIELTAKCMGSIFAHKTAKDLAEALQANEEALNRYIEARNRAEMKAVLDSLAFDSTREYLITRLSLEPPLESREAAAAWYKELEDVLGKKHVDAAAEAIRKMRKGSHGNITDPKQIGPYGIPSYLPPESRFMSTHDLLTLHAGNSSDTRAYVIGLIRRERKVSWTRAREIYEHYWVKPFGEAQVLKTAEPLRKAKKEVMVVRDFLLEPMAGTQWAEEALINLMPENPYKDYPLGSLDASELRPFLYAVIKQAGQAKHWIDAPAACQAMEKQHGSAVLEDAARKLMKAEKDAQSQLADPGALGVKSRELYPALKELLGQMGQRPDVRFARLLAQEDDMKMRLEAESQVSNDVRPHISDGDRLRKAEGLQQKSFREYKLLAAAFGPEHVNGTLERVEKTTADGKSLTELEGAVSGFNSPGLVFYDILWATAPPECYVTYLAWREELRHGKTADEQTAQRVHDRVEQWFERHGRDTVIEAAGKVSRAKRQPFSLVHFVHSGGGEPRLVDVASVGLPSGASGSADQCFEALLELREARAEGSYVRGDRFEVMHRGKWQEATVVARSGTRDYLLQIESEGRRPEYLTQDAAWLKANSRPIGSETAAEAPASEKSRGDKPAPAPATSEQPAFGVGQAVEVRSRDGQWCEGTIVSIGKGRSTGEALYRVRLAKKDSGGRLSLSVEPDAIRIAPGVKVGNPYPVGSVLRIGLGRAWVNATVVEYIWDKGWVVEYAIQQGGRERQYKRLMTWDQLEQSGDPGRSGDQESAAENGADD